MALADYKLKFFADLIQKEIGIIYSTAVYFQLEQRLEKCVTKFNLGTTDKLYDLAFSEGINGELKAFFLDISTNNETSFFRDTKLFNAIEKNLIPNLSKNFPGTFSFRIWCAASSFGQEPYSMAILIHEFLKLNPKHPKIEVMTSDISDQALERCKKAIYSNLEINRGLTPERIRKYFTEIKNDQWKLNDEICNIVSVRKQNLLDSFQALGQFHVILCRYVLIYQDVEKKKSIIQKLVNSLYPNGTLILGASESAFGLTTELSQSSITDGAIVYKKDQSLAA